MNRQDADASNSGRLPSFRLGRAQPCVDIEDIPEVDFSKAKLIGVGLFKERRLSLRVLREGVGKTQVDVAKLPNMRKGDVSQLERRQDVKLSTLRRYVEALGGRLQIVATFPTGHRINVDM